MNIQEQIDRKMCGDARVYQAIQNQKQHDTSFTEKGFLGIEPKYKQSDVRDIWFRAMALGMQEGLRMGSLEGQKIDITQNCKNERHKEFYKKFLELAEEYKCGIQYHPTIGMCVMDLKRNQ